MLQLLKQLFVYPFTREGYREFYSFSKKKVAVFLTLFFVLMFLIRVVPVLVRAPFAISDVWQQIKGVAYMEIKKTDFGYIGIKDDMLVSDLREQPFVREYKEGKVLLLVVVDPTGTVDMSMLNNRKGYEVNGVLLLKDRMVIKSSNGRTDMREYAEFMEGKEFSVTKQQILTSFENDSIEKAMKGFLANAGVLFWLVVSALVVMLGFAVAAIIAMAWWAFWVALFAFVLLPKIRSKRFVSALKLSFLAYVGAWYIKTLVGITFSTSLFGMGTITKYAVFIFFVWFVYDNLKQIGTKTKTSS